MSELIDRTRLFNAFVYHELHINSMFFAELMLFKNEFKLMHEDGQIEVYSVSEVLALLKKCLPGYLFKDKYFVQLKRNTDTESSDIDKIVITVVYGK